ncbi:MAG: sugar phosphate nucleotidyltransferase [Candidatus Moraniibacteriota bacterium]
MYSVILCGGSGTRLWPLSRKNYPKQFLKLYSEHSLLQETYLRMRKLMPMERIYFITNQDGFSTVLEQIHEIDATFETSQVIIEPKSLNTAPAMACAVKYLQSEKAVGPDEKVLFLPSDHYIGNVESYIATLKTAFETVGEYIGTIGIRALTPETGYGYIKKGAPENGHFSVVQFCEKPDKIVAAGYVQSGEYVWNSGMYLMSIETFIREIQQHAPEIAASLKGPWSGFIEDFDALPSISFDYAVSEKSSAVVVYEGDFGWSDIGSFDSLAEISGGTRTETRHIGIDSEHVFVHSASDRLVATIGVDNLTIIETPDSILVCRRGRTEEVKKIVEILKASGAREVESNHDEDRCC